MKTFFRGNKLNTDDAGTVSAKPMNIRTFIVASSILTATCIAQPPDLIRADAKRILEHMEWKEVNVIAIRQGVSAKGEVAPIYATVLGFASRDSKNQQVCQTLIFDNEIGWHHLEMQEKTARVWAKEGYREVKIWSTWWSGTSNAPAAPERPSSR